ncbi:MAG: hypothetical protein ACI32C_00455 [Candidatus Enteromonas sp.]
MKNVKKILLPLLLIPASTTLFSCGSQESKAIDSLDDFIEVASKDDVAIIGVNVVENAKKGDETSSGTTRRANLYAEGNYTMTSGDKNVIGYTYHAPSGTTQYIKIDTRTKRGEIYDDANVLNDDRAFVENQLDSDYAKLATVYDAMKGQVGKSAEDLGYDTFTLACSVAPNVAGYVSTGFKTTVDGAVTKTIEASRYLTMDKIEGKWCFTNYAERITTTTVEKRDDAPDIKRTVYDVTDVRINVSKELPSLAISLGTYTIRDSNATVDRIVFDDGVPSSKK